MFQRSRHDASHQLRHRTTLVQTRSAVANRLHKALEGANITLTSVASDMMGRSARAMIEALIQGEDNPNVLAQLAKGKLKLRISTQTTTCSGR